MTASVQGQFEANGVSFWQRHEIDPLITSKVWMETRALIELLDRHDEVIGRYRVGAEPTRIGCGLGCDIVLGRPHTAEHHASLRTTEQGWLLELPTKFERRPA